MCSACSLNGNNSFVWIICQLRIVRTCVIVFMTTMLYVCVYMYFSSFREPWSKVKQGVREERHSSKKIPCEVLPIVTGVLHKEEHIPNNENLRLKAVLVMINSCVTKSLKKSTWPK